MSTVKCMDMISGRWKLIPEGGRLPPGIRMTVKGDHGWLKLGRVPIGRFRVRGSSFQHRLLPMRDELEGRDGRTLYGRSLLFGRPIGRFRLELEQGPEHGFPISA